MDKVIPCEDSTWKNATISDLEITGGMRCRRACWGTMKLWNTAILRPQDARATNVVDIIISRTQLCCSLAGICVSKEGIHMCFHFDCYTFVPNGFSQYRDTALTATISEMPVAILQEIVIVPIVAVMEFFQLRALNDTCASPYLKYTSQLYSYFLGHGLRLLGEATLCDAASCQVSHTTSWRAGNVSQPPRVFANINARVHRSQYCTIYGFVEAHDSFMARSIRSLCAATQRGRSHG